MPHRVESHKTESSALVRCKELAKRSAFDLSLAHDAAIASNIPFVHLAKIKRARREMNDLLRDLSKENSEERTLCEIKDSSQLVK
jgi:hypothetical protein